MKKKYHSYDIQGKYTDMGAQKNPPAQRRGCSVIPFNNPIASRKGYADQCVALVSGGAVLGFDDEVHIDLDRSHIVLSPDEARQFSDELKRIADTIDPLPGHEHGE